MRKNKEEIDGVHERNSKLQVSTTQYEGKLIMLVHSGRQRVSS